LAFTCVSIKYFLCFNVISSTIWMSFSKQLYILSLFSSCSHTATTTFTSPPPPTQPSPSPPPLILLRPPPPLLLLLVVVVFYYSIIIIFIMIIIILTSVTNPMVCSITEKFRPVPIQLVNEFSALYENRNFVTTHTFTNSLQIL
jgi:hypothetical protein